MTTEHPELTPEQVLRVEAMNCAYKQHGRILKPYNFNEKRHLTWNECYTTFKGELMFWFNAETGSTHIVKKKLEAK